MTDRASVVWRDMSELPAELEGHRLLLWLEKGEKGNGELAVGMIYRNDDGSIDGYWTWGGPNSGSDISEPPTKWALLPFDPTGSIHD